jgi:hypothetical protein
MVEYTIRMEHMKDRVSKLVRTERHRWGVLLLVPLVLLLASFLPAPSPAADTPESNPSDVANPTNQSKTEVQRLPSPTRHDAQRLEEEQRPKRSLAPQRIRASYPIVGQGSQGALRSAKRARSDFNRSMRNLNDSLRRANDAINRIRSLNKKF